MEDYDFLVFIGRFQPFHHGHLRVINAALEQAGHVVILCGSAHRPRCLRNPLDFVERERMIRAALKQRDLERISVLPVMDQIYNEEVWVKRVQTAVAGVVAARHRRPQVEPGIGLIGHSKDHSSYYLKRFPQWGCVDVKNYQELSSSAIRSLLFDADIGTIDDRLRLIDTQLNNPMPRAVANQLAVFAKSEAFTELEAEHTFVNQYLAGWSAAPYPPTFVTVDAVVVQSGHVLLVERRARPGRGQWALPGGFINQRELVEDACLRELREETRLKVPEPVLRGSIKARKVYDDPYRSIRGRTVTHAFLIELRPERALPAVKGGDDARAAFWKPLADIEPEYMFEDHYFIIQNLVGA
jgi:bifunctional NMN adenylyltransferase/nudix hydrolase